MGLADGRPAVLIQISRQPNANIIDTVERVKAVLPQFQASLPPTITLRLDNDRTNTIQASVKDAERSMAISISLVVLVVFFFLRNGWATFIPSVSVPVSLISTFGAMYLLGYTLDNLSLMALTIATGFVVDDAIVVIENITRHIENGVQPLQAALRGAQEIGFTVLSMSISLIAVFIPILMMPGIVGRLFREFAVVLSIAIAISMVVSLTATPMMCARLLKVKHTHGWLYNVTERMFQWIISTYSSALEVVLDHTAITMLVMAVTIGVNVYLYIKIPKGFFPQQDTGRLQGQIQGQQHISFAALSDKVRFFEAQVRSDPDVDSVDAFAGAGSGGGRGGGNSAQLFCQLKPVGVRHATGDEIIARIRRKTAGMPGATLVSSIEPGRPGGRQAGQRPIPIHHPDPGSEAAGGVGSAGTGADAVDSRDSGREFGSAELGPFGNVTIDRDTASRLGLTAQAVDSALYDAFGQRQVSVMYKSINQYHVVLALDRSGGRARLLDKIYVQTPRGIEVPFPLRQFARASTPLSLPHQGGFQPARFPSI